MTNLRTKLFFHEISGLKDKYTTHDHKITTCKPDFNIVGLYSQLQFKLGNKFEVEMALSLRFYLFEENGNIRRLPYTKYNALKKGKITLPEYATKSVKMVEVVLNLIDRKPDTIERVVGNTMYFDENGSFEKDYSDHFNLVTKNISYLLSTDDEPTSKIINAENLFNEKTLNDRYYWDLTPNDITRLVETIWATKTKKKTKHPKLKLIKS